MSKQSNHGKTMLRPQSAILRRNYQSIELHSRLDQAKKYTDQVKNHFIKTQFQNHVLQSAQRDYKQKEILLKTRSSLGFGKKQSSRVSVGRKTFQNLSSFKKQHANPQHTRILSLFELKTLKISQLKDEFDDETQQKLYLKKNIEQLKQLMVAEKNRKAKVSLMNSKLMNLSEASNYQIQKLDERSRRNEIQIKEMFKEVETLYRQNCDLQNQNQAVECQIRITQSNIKNLDIIVKDTKRKLHQERTKMQIIKEYETISFKQMANSYMILNQRKEEKALLLNSIDDNIMKNM